MQCFIALNKVRGNALCLRASGLASRFYDSGSKNYFIHREVCEEVIPKCSKTFISIIKLQRFVTLLVNFKYAFTQSNEETEGGLITDDSVSRKSIQ